MLPVTIPSCTPTRKDVPSISVDAPLRSKDPTLAPALISFRMLSSISVEEGERPARTSAAMPLEMT